MLLSSKRRRVSVMSRRRDRSDEAVCTFWIFCLRDKAPSLAFIQREGYVMPGRHSESAGETSDPEATRRAKFLVSVGAVILLAVVGVGLYALFPGSRDHQHTVPATTVVTPAIGPDGECLGEYFAVPKTSWGQGAVAKGSATTRIDLELENHGVACKIIYPRQATLTAANGSTSSVPMTVPSSSMIAAGAHLTVRIVASYPARACTESVSPNSITLEFGGQKLQVALPANFHTAAWAHGCLSGASTTTLDSAT